MRIQYEAMKVVMVILAMPLGLCGQAEELVQTHIALELELTYESATLAGSAALTIRNDGAVAVRRVPLLLGRLMTATSVDDPEGALSFSTDVIRFADWPEYQVLQLWVELRDALEPGESAQFTVTYDGIMVGYTETGMSYVRDHIAPEFTIIRSDALSFPTIGTASLNSMRRQRHEDFTFEGTITVPGDSLIVAAGAKPEVVNAQGDKRTWRFASTDPAPFLLITVAPYHILNSDQAVVYHFPADRVGAERLLRATERASELYTRWFGPKPGAARVTIMEIPEGWGSQASLAGGIIQTADAFRSGDDLPQLYHEIAHLWHPKDLERPADRWNEGFASFLQWRVALDGDPEALRTRMDQIAASVSAMGPASLVPMDRYGEENRTDLAYHAGTLFFYVLHETLGADTFDQCLAAYLQNFSSVGGDNTDFVDSLGACHSTARRVFADWFLSTGGVRMLRTGKSLSEIVSEYRTSSGVGQETATS